MSAKSHAPDAVVLGGGIIGLAVAWQAARRGLDVTVLDAGHERPGASHVAAGMLAPAAEVEFGAAGRDLLELSLASAGLWPGFAAELEADGGVRCGLRESGTMLLARDHDEAEALNRELEFRDRAGVALERLTPSLARELEPALAPAVRLAALAPDDHSVDPRSALEALRAAAQARGVRIERCAPIADAAEIDAPAVVVATGAWSAELAPAVPVRPVKGQILRLRDPAGPGLLQRVLRYDVGYIVPRADGRYAVGATMEERGFDTTTTAGAVRELLRDAREIVPGIDELEIEEICAGLRPGTPDNLPLIGRRDDGGPVWATGHHRNGILLAPLTAELVAGLLAGDTASAHAEAHLAACDPDRFARVEAPA